MKHTQEENRKRFPRLFAWWQAAKAHGTVYSRVDVSRSGMSATVLLWTVQDGVVQVAWPDSHTPDGVDSEACAKAIGWSRARRAFRVNGCGFDRVQEVVTRLCSVFDGYTGSGEQIAAFPRMETLNYPD